MATKTEALKALNFGYLVGLKGWAEGCFIEKSGRFYLDETGHTVYLYGAEDPPYKDEDWVIYEPVITDLRG